MMNDAWVYIYPKSNDGGNSDIGSLTVRLLAVGVAANVGRVRPLSNMCGSVDP
jgi:hypothetical protein